MVGNWTERPWGGFFSIINNYYELSIKLLFVEGRTSLQSHKERSERFYCVGGEATIEKDGREFKLSAGDTTFIPTGAKHRISGKCVIIEVSIGHFDENDIERFEDDYGRVERIVPKHV